MKKNVILLLMVVLFSYTINAQNIDYTVYKINGKVSFVNTTKPIHTSYTLTENDTINIGQSSNISFISKKEHKVYAFSQEGIFSVTEIVNICKKQNNIVYRIVNETQKNINRGDNKNITSVGAVYRSDVDEELTESIYTHIINVIKDNAIDYSSNDITITQIYAEDNQIFTIKVINNSDIPLFFDIALYDKGKLPTFTIEKNDNNNCFWIEKKTYIEFTQKFLNVNQKLLLVCSDQEFDSEELNYRLQNQMEPLAIQNDYTVFINSPKQ